MRHAIKERAVTTANSNHSAKIKLHSDDSTISSRQMQERFSQNNGIILRNIFNCNVLWQSVEHMQRDITGAFGINREEFWTSICYLTSKGYIIQLIDGQTVLFGGTQIKINPLSVFLLAGKAKDANVDV